MSPSLRRGLPRFPGGEPWPPEGTEVPATHDVPEPGAAAPTQTAPQPTGQTFRRGLPRVAGGEPWPPADAAPTTGTAPEEPPASPEPPAQNGAPLPATAEGEARRGLPRLLGGEPWPPQGTMVAGAFLAAPSTKPRAPAPSLQAPEPEPARSSQPATPPPAPAPGAIPPPVAPAPVPAASPEAAKKAEPAPRAEPKKYGIFTIRQWIGAGSVIALAIVGAVTLVVLAARWFLGLEFMQSFMSAYPGEYDLPESAPVGFPGWLGWQHFFNIFLMVLIIRSGILVRRQERPEAFWASKKNPKKISIHLWLHQSLNILWVVNGAIFIILLFATGQWMRVIPTSPEVFPNALSALLQYLTLDWPLDNGWVNYNSLQQLAYFATIFIAAPLSAITGYRMSESWPRESKLSEKFPVEWARALHFPLMIYFVGFIVVHVALVFSTGALRNLNHMFAAQGSVDPGAYANNWTGFWWFVLSMVVVVGGWIAARPMIIAPIARIFGNVSAR